MIPIDFNELTKPHHLFLKTISSHLRFLMDSCTFSCCMSNMATIRRRCISHITRCCHVVNLYQFWQRISGPHLILGIVVYCTGYPFNAGYPPKKWFFKLLVSLTSSIVTVVAGASWKAGIKVPGARSHTATR